MIVQHRLVEGEAEELQVGAGSEGMAEDRSLTGVFLENGKAEYGKGWAKASLKVKVCAFHQKEMTACAS
jgi:hypothetical protein